MSSSQSTPFVSAFAISLPGDLLSPLEIARVGELRDGTFDPEADVWAIRCMSRCLGHDGEWEFEPLPSSRDDEFKARTRWRNAEALVAAQAAVEAGNYPGGKAFRWAS